VRIQILTGINSIKKIYILWQNDYKNYGKNTKKLINIIDNLSNPFKYKTNTNTK